MREKPFLVILLILVVGPRSSGRVVPASLLKDNLLTNGAAAISNMHLERHSIAENQKWW